MVNVGTQTKTLQRKLKYSGQEKENFVFLDFLACRVKNFVNIKVVFKE